MVLKGAACHWEAEAALELLDQDEPDDRSHDGLFKGYDGDSECPALTVYTPDWTFLTLVLGWTGFRFSPP